MQTTTNTETILKGGEFLLKASEPFAVFTPEDFTEDQLLLRQSLRDFVKKEIEPIKEIFDTKAGIEKGPELLEKMGQLGFLGIGVPEEYGGFEADFKTQLAFGEVAYATYAFGLTVGVQTSLGVAPLLLYGSKQQKEKYLPKIVSAELKSCYCLTEPGAGSDANSGKTKASLSEDKSHYLLSGQKMWITNSGYADLFFVFAKIEDDKNLSCLIVEKGYGGITLGAEEEKMGIRGSSTRQVFFEQVKVPVENLLGERNGGLKIALNVLNTGRIKMSGSITGNAKRAFNLAVEYANNRIQFNQPIAKFGAMQHKIAEMAASLFAMESIFCRVGHMIDQVNDEMVDGGMDVLEAKYKSIAEFAMECAIAKVHNTEALGVIVDESLQMHGGMGFSAESEIETLYRNARIDRIYEGTNEINRMLAVDMLLRKAMKGKIDLMAPAMGAIQELMESSSTDEPMDSMKFSEEKHALINFKKAALAISGIVGQKLAANLKDEQEVLMNMADIFIQIFAFESVLLRTMKHQEGAEGSTRHNLTMIIMHRAAFKILQSGTEAINAVTEGEEAQTMLAGLQRLTKLSPCNLKTVRRTAAEFFIEKNQYQL